MGQGIEVGKKEKTQIEREVQGEKDKGTNTITLTAVTMLAIFMELSFHKSWFVPRNLAFK